jgi:hypothetical protein
MTALMADHFPGNVDQPNPPQKSVQFLFTFLFSGHGYGEKFILQAHAETPIS